MATSDLNTFVQNNNDYLLQWGTNVGISINTQSSTKYLYITRSIADGVWYDETNGWREWSSDGQSITYTPMDTSKWKTLTFGSPKQLTQEMFSQSFNGINGVVVGAVVQ